MNPDELITIVTTTSPIPSHPSTKIIDTTYESVRKHLPNAKYLFLFDGVRSEQEHLQKAYEEYRITIAARIIEAGIILQKGAFSNCDYVMFGEFTHQGGMIRRVLELGYIKTPLILWVEHDFPFNDLPIDWPRIVETLINNEVCYIRFALPEETIANIRGEAMTAKNGLPLMRIMDYSSLPHVARTDFFLRLVKEFKEGKIHLECEATNSVAFRETNWKLALYTPPGEFGRFYSLDGRGGPEKFPTVL